jgi:hypothetical protein
MSPHNETFLEGSNLPIILLYKTRENWYREFSLLGIETH